MGTAPLCHQPFPPSHDVDHQLPRTHAAQGKEPSLLLQTLKGHLFAVASTRAHLPFPGCQQISFDTAEGTDTSPIQAIQGMSFPR